VADRSGEGDGEGRRVMADYLCCQGARWTCEAHAERPWPHDECHGSGEPCPLQYHGAAGDADRLSSLRQGGRCY
jgi:hypothetical protein